MIAPPLPEKEYEKAASGKKTDLGTTFHISFALPKERVFNSRTSYFTLTNTVTSTPPMKSIVINDLDKQLRKNLEDTRTSTLTRTIIRTTLRTIAAEKAKGEMKTDNPIANILIGLGTDVLADQLESADTRTCFLVPKTVQIARMPVTPGTYSFDVEARSIDGYVIEKKSFSNLTIKKGEKKFIIVSSFQ